MAEFGKAHTGVRIDYGGGGSGKGIADLTAGTVDFAGSDAPMSKKEKEAAKGEVVHIPTVAGAVVPACNVPGLKGDLNLTGAVIADIYLGKIKKWNDAAIAALNKGEALPDLAITPVWRTDGSGTSFVFTNYLATQSEEFLTKVGVGKSVNWPTGEGAKGNPGVAEVVGKTPGAIGYMEQNYAVEKKIPFAAVQNKDGKFVKASPEAVSKAGEGAVADMKAKGLTVAIWNQPGDAAYPISAFTYLLVFKDLHNLKSKEQAQTLVDFIWWATHDAQKMAPEMSYAPLSESVTKLVEEAVLSLTYNGQALKPAGAK